MMMMMTDAFLDHEVQGLPRHLTKESRILSQCCTILALITNVSKKFSLWPKVQYFVCRVLKWRSRVMMMITGDFLWSWSLPGHL